MAQASGTQARAVEGPAEGKAGWGPTSAGGRPRGGLHRFLETGVTQAPPPRGTPEAQAARPDLRALHRRQRSGLLEGPPRG